MEGDAGAGDEVFDGAGDKHFARLCVCGHAGAGVDGDSGDFAVGEFALAGVQAGADVEADLRRVSTIAQAQRIARAGPSKEAKKPSPAVSTSWPRKRPSCCADELVVLFE